MKHLKLITFTVLLIAITSCGNTMFDDEATLLNNQLQSRSGAEGIDDFDIPVITEVQKKFLSECIKVDSAHNFYITITMNEALEMGITKEEYEETSNSINYANAHLEKVLAECAADPKIKKVTITEMKPNFDIEISRTRKSLLRSAPEGNTEQMPGGTIITYNTLPASTYFFAPMSMKGINCNCFCSALSGYHYVTTTFFGEKNCSRGIGYSAQFVVSIAASNTSGTLSYETSSSNGGKCVWVGQ